MGFIRERSELRTGYQEKDAWAPELDLQCDFVMAYGLDNTLRSRIAKFREQGYEVHLMTGCAWGAYEDYLNGKWDGTGHWDECQTDRNGEKIMHGINTPYMVPTLNFAAYLTEKLCGLVDFGISAIHMEEPEFWDAGGYSPTFQREYEEYYRETYVPPHTSVKARYRCSELKAWLYARLIAQVSRAVKEYSRKTCDRETAFYVATHSLVNYTQWKIMSPGSRMADMPDVDGFIAQVWSGTSGTGNVYQGSYKSRTFETAYLEYGSMQEMNCGTGKRMWFLHDPVEDFPENGWETYRKKYIKTVTASLFWPDVNRYEVCPWPNRVFNGRYPRKLGMGDGMIPTEDMEGSKDIPAEYAAMLCGMIQTLGNMDREEAVFLENNISIGLLVEDSSLYQRSFPDAVEAPGTGKTVSMQGEEEEMNRQILSLHGSEKEQAFYEGVKNDDKSSYAYTASCAYPAFFGLAMPLLKHGLPIRPVYRDFSRFRYLIVSYEYCKPEHAYRHEVLADWVREGGCLIYVGDGSDPYSQIQAWWNETGGSNTPAGHLFSTLGQKERLPDGIYPVGKGWLAVLNRNPAELTLSARAADDYRGFVKDALAAAGDAWMETNCLVMRRGSYLIAAAMDESCAAEGYTAKGLYTDLLGDGFPVLETVSVPAGNEGLYFDYGTIEKETLCIVAAAARIESLSCDEEKLELTAKAADRIHVSIRLRMPFCPETVYAVDEDGDNIEVSFCWEEASRTALFCYESRNRRVRITASRK